MKLNSVLLLVFFTAQALAQSRQPQHGDFIFPIRPKQENYLSGTVGELRKTHFHMGLDIKTSGITGLPVYATADGYVQRIRVSTSGYGNAIYMMHPETGTISVYAHLKTFDPALAAFVRSKQYESESFEVNLFPKKNQFRFLQGDIIAQSGNTGSSAGPHLHFEIRTSDHLVLDPLNYGFEEIKDNTAPTLEKIAFVTKDIDARVNGEFGRHEFVITKNEAGEYFLLEDIFLHGLIGVEIYAYDRLDGASNRNGILYQTLTLDQKVIFNQAMDSLKFADAKSIFIHTNFQRAAEGGRRFNKLFIDDGNALDFYEVNEKQGLIHIQDPLTHELSIRLADSYGNVTQVQIPINKQDGKNTSGRVSSTFKKKGYDHLDNFLEFKADLSKYGYCEAGVFVSGDRMSCQLAYDRGDQGFYIWDLRRGLPDSIKVCDEKYEFSFSKMIPSSVKTQWRDKNIDITFPAKCLFDTTYIKYEYAKDEEGEYFKFDNKTTPFKRYYYATLHPERPYNKEKSAVYAMNGSSTSYVGGEWRENEIAFKSRSLGAYTILEDTTPPVITLISSKNAQLKFRIDDKDSGIKEFRAELDGRWLLMNYDSKRKLIWSDKQVVVSGHFKLKVTDQMNNGTVFEADY